MVTTHLENKSLREAWFSFRFLREEGFLIFCLFPMCSLRRPKAPQFLSHFCFKFNFYIYNLFKGGGIGMHDKACFHFGKSFYVWECTMLKKNIDDGQSNDSWEK
jgi:hypothetical protein